MSTLQVPEIETRDETGRLTAEGLLRRRARQRPAMAALSDPPNREALGYGRPKSFTYGEADAAVDALAAHFIELGLEPGNRIAVQLPNLAEQPLVLLAAWRAGLTVIALPMLWRGYEIGKICDEAEPRALVGIATTGSENQAEMLCRVAATRLAVRFVLGFGSDLPDGVASLDAVVETGRGTPHLPVGAPKRDGPAMITFTARAGAPLLPVFRGEDEILAQGAMTVLALSLDRSDVILNPYPFTGPAGLALGLAPWLIAGARLVQHQPFDYAEFVRQLLASGATVTALPSPIRAELAKDGVLQRPQCRLRRLGCVWSPAELAQAQPPSAAALASFFDLYPLGDLASLVLRRELRANAALLPLGKVHLGEDEGGGAVFLETTLGKTGGGRSELRLRGPVVPCGLAGGPLGLDGEGFVATGLCASADGDGKTLRLARDPELFHHGGFAVAACELDELYRTFPGFLDAACFTLPDPVVGDRIFAAVVPRPGEPISLDAVHGFLTEREVAPYKFPDRLLVVKQIPRDAQSRVLREQILKQV